MKLSRTLSFSLIVLALMGTFSAVHADDAIPSAGLTKHEFRQANWQLEKSVRKQLDKSLGDSSDILIVARSGAVTLDGKVWVVSAPHSPLPQRQSLPLRPARRAGPLGASLGR